MSEEDRQYVNSIMANQPVSVLSQEQVKSNLQLVMEREQQQDIDMSDSSVDSQQERDILNVKEDDVINADKFKTVSEIAEQKLIKQKLEKIESREERLARLQVQDQVNSMTTDQLHQCGVIQSIFEDTIIIKGDSSLILDLQNIVFMSMNDQNIEVLGIIDDVLGNIEMPFYRVLIDQFILKMIKEQIIKPGDNVFIKQENSKILNMIDIQTKLAQKGCDASNRFDEEVNNREDRDFSDDDFDRRSHHSVHSHISKQSNRPQHNKKQMKIQNKNPHRQHDGQQQMQMPYYANHQMPMYPNQYPF